MIRKATEKDIDAIEAIYDRIHTEQEQGRTVIGWQRGIYPTRQTAEMALQRQDLFVMTDAEGQIVAAAIFNQRQDDFYFEAPWQYPCEPGDVMVMHTLVTDPAVQQWGHGSAFAEFYEEYALKQDCHYLHIDTNERNTTARRFYRNRGYREIGVCPCDFNGLMGVRLVLLEKKI
jgi:GNAT superfamily N-acetyltransferase